MKKNLFKDVILYHATPTKNLDDIKKNGLKKSFSESSLPAIFLTDDLFTALNYVNMRPEENYSILAVKLSNLDDLYLVPDNYELQEVLENLTEEESEELGYPQYHNDLTWQQSLKLCCQVAYVKDIPVKNIYISKKKDLDLKDGGLKNFKKLNQKSLKSVI